MRIEIELKAKTRDYTVPLTYNYMIHGAIYRLLSQSSQEFTKWLHQKGFITDEGRAMKLFTFSKLFFEKLRVEKDVIRAQGWCKLLFSTPIDDKIITNIIMGMLSNNFLTLADRLYKTDFLINKITTLPYPDFGTADYIMLSATTSSTMREYNGKLSTYYYRPGDKELHSSLEKNLLSKFKLVTGKAYSGELHISLDQDYLESRRGKGVSKLITIKRGSGEETKVKAFISPLKIIGTKEIKKVAYDCCIGEKNSMGFGMIDVSGR